MVEEINLRSDNAKVLQLLEEVLALFGRAKPPRVFPEPKTQAALPGVLHEFLDFLIAPAGPIAFDHVVFETQFARETAEFFGSFQRAVAAVHVFPNGATWLEP